MWETVIQNIIAFFQNYFKMVRHQHRGGGRLCLWIPLRAVPPEPIIGLHSVLNIWPPFPKFLYPPLQAVCKMYVTYAVSTDRK